MKKQLLFFTLLLTTLTCFAEQTLFKNGDYHLEALRINGKERGKTLLIFGGIHGDEPGAHLSSELLRNIHLEKGQLIIVPRVNFPSIMLNRREVHGDMNRKFTDKQNPTDPEQPIIDRLKELMAEADIFINQHDASGFHRKKHISALYNPMKYGQSLIVDTGSLDSPRHGKILDLEAIGLEIVERVNARIHRPEHHFCFWNHNSLHPDTTFVEMKSSATHYAAAHFKIPAFGLETSKDLPTLEDKIRGQLLVIQEIMNAFDFRYHLEDIDIPEPTLFWVECKSATGETIRVNKNTIVRLNPGELITIDSVSANYPSGLSADILSWGGLNDIGKPFSYDKPRTIYIRKNHIHIGRIFFRAPHSGSLRRLGLRLNGKETDIPNWGVVKANRTDTIQILSPSPGTSLRWTLNHSAPEEASSAFLLPKDPSLIEVSTLVNRFSLLGQGHIYDIRVYHKQELVGGFHIELDQDR